MSPSSKTRSTSSSTTKKKLLKATERVILDHGIQAITIRRIAAKAKANVSLIGYHFDSLEGLLISLLDDNIEHFLYEERRLMQSLLKEDSSPNLEKLLTVVLKTLLTPAVYNKEARSSAIIDAIFSNINEISRKTAVKKLQINSNLFLSQLKPLLPHLDEASLLWRLSAISSTVMNMAPGASIWTLFSSYAGKRAANQRGNLEHMLNYSLSVLMAPEKA